MKDFSFVCVCPVYGTPIHLLEECIQCFLDQTYQDKFLIIYDDLGTVDHRAFVHDEVMIISSKKREPTLNSKYQYIAELTRSSFAALAVWEVDDIYLPNHLEEHNRVLQNHPFSYPKEVWVTGKGYPTLERTGGNLFASCAVRMDALHDCGGFVTSPRADADMQSIARFATLGRGVGETTYMFRWGDTDAPHGQSSMKGPDDETWYANYKPAYTEPINVIIPGYRAQTKEMIRGTSSTT